MCAVALLLAGSVSAADLNIVVLDSVRAILETEEAQTLIEAANKEMEPEQEDLRSMAEEAQALTSRLQTDGEVMSDAEKRKVQKDIEDIRIDLEFRSQKLQKDAQDKRNEILQVLAPKFEKVRRDLIEAQQIDIILAPGALAYVNPRHNITRRITEKMNEQQD